MKQKLITFTLLFVFIFHSNSVFGGKAVQKGFYDPQELVHNTVYPDFAKKYGIGGTVLVRAYIDNISSVTKTLIEKTTSSFLNGAAIEAVKKTNFTKKKESGWVDIPVKFDMDSSAADNCKGCDTLSEKQDRYGIRYLDLKQGYDRPSTYGDEVYIHINIYLAGGKLLYSTYKDFRAINFEIGYNEVFSGLEKSVTGLRYAGKRLALVPGSMVNKDNPVLPDFDKSQDLVLEIEMIKIKQE